MGCRWSFGLKPCSYARYPIRSKIKPRIIQGSRWAENRLKTSRARGPSRRPSSRKMAARIDADIRTHGTNTLEGTLRIPDKAEIAIPGRRALLRSQRAGAGRIFLAEPHTSGGWKPRGE